MPRTLLYLAALLATTFIATAAPAIAEQATLHASFSPDRLGTPTTISFAFQLTGESGAPPPLTHMALRMPAGLNYTTTTLGLALCEPTVLATAGPAGCPADSQLGSGSAIVEVPFGTGAGHEIPLLSAVAGPSKQGNLAVLFYASGLYPVDAQLSFAGEVLPDHRPYGTQLDANIPLVASVPGGPDVSIVRVQATIGPAHLLYYRHIDGRRVAFHPRGIAVPEHCPTGGFPFAANFTFQDESHTSAQTTVPCPPRRRSGP